MIPSPTPGKGKAFGGYVCASCGLILSFQRRLVKDVKAGKRVLALSRQRDPERTTFDHVEGDRK